MAGTVDVDARIAVVLEARKLMERATRWLLVNRRPSFGIAETVSFFSSGVSTVRASIPKLLSGSDLSGYEERRASFTGQRRPRRARGRGRGDGAVLLRVRHRDERRRDRSTASRRPRRCTSCSPTGCSSAGCAT